MMFSEILRKIYFLPYSIFTLPQILAVLILPFVVIGVKGYFFVSLGIFACHLLARRIFKKKFDYPIIFQTRSSKTIINKPYLSPFLLSFVLAIFISPYLGVIPKGIAELINGLFYGLLGMLLYFAALLIPGVIAFSLLVLSDMNKISASKKVRFGLFLVLMSVQITILNVQSVIDFPFTHSAIVTYVAKLLFAAPTLYLIKMLFFGFNDNEFKEAFGTNP